MPLISPRDFTQTGIDFSRLKKVAINELHNFKKKCDPEIGDILFSRIGTIGEARLLNFDFDFVALHSIALLKRRNEGVEFKYLLYLMQSPTVQAQAKQGIKSVGTPDLGLKRMNDFCVPLAPLKTQIALTQKIEELFSDLDAGVAALKRAQANLKRYRAAVLKAAVEGRLTAQWRAERKTKGIATEPAAKLLERILAERRKKWEVAQLKKYADAGKAPPKGWQSKYPEPVKPLNGDFPALPDGWGWASLDQMSIALTSGSRDWSQYYDRGAGVFIMAQNVRPWRPDFSYVQLVDPPLNNSDRVRSKVEKDDLLVTIVGANTGDFCRVETELNDHFVCQSVALIRPVYSELSKFINTWFNSAENGQRYFDKCMYGQGRPHLGFEELRVAPIAVPSLDEQTEIVSQVEAKLSNIAQADAEIKRSLERAARLRQAILKRAFEGRLV